MSIDFENSPESQAPIAEATALPPREDVTQSALALQNSLSTAANAWMESLNKTLQAVSTLAWLPFHDPSLWKMAYSGALPPRAVRPTVGQQPY